MEMTRADILLAPLPLTEWRKSRFGPLWLWAERKKIQGKYRVNPQLFEISGLIFRGFSKLNPKGAGGI
jgi:hypothetical protein